MSIKTYKTRDIAKRMTAKRSLLADRRNDSLRLIGQPHSTLESTQYEVRESQIDSGPFVGGTCSELAANQAYSYYRIIAQYSAGYLVED